MSENMLKGLIKEINGLNKERNDLENELDEEFVSTLSNNEKATYEKMKTQLASEIQKNTSDGGLVLGTGVSGVALAAMSGASAAGITSGLASIGGLIGGGMLSGVGVLAALPFIFSMLGGVGSEQSIKIIVEKRQRFCQDSPKSVKIHQLEITITQKTKEFNDMLNS